MSPLKKIIGACIIMLLFFNFCSQKPIYNSDNLLITKKYVGQFDTVVPSIKKYSKVYTTKEIIDVKNLDTIPTKGTNCYLQLKKIRLANSTNMWVVFFTWNGTEKLYLVNENNLFK